MECRTEMCAVCDCSSHIDMGVDILSIWGHVDEISVIRGRKLGWSHTDIWGAACSVLFYGDDRAFAVRRVVILFELASNYPVKRCTFSIVRLYSLFNRSRQSALLEPNFSSARKYRAKGTYEAATNPHFLLGVQTMCGRCSALRARVDRTAARCKFLSFLSLRTNPAE